MRLRTWVGAGTVSHAGIVYHVIPFLRTCLVPGHARIVQATSFRSANTLRSGKWRV